jgi:hypothetical protein
MKSFLMAFSAVALIFAASACNPNRSNPNYNTSQSQQPGAIQTPGTSGSTSDTGVSGGTGTTSENR